MTLLLSSTWQHFLPFPSIWLNFTSHRALHYSVIMYSFVTCSEIRQNFYKSDILLYSIDNSRNIIFLSLPFLINVWYGTNCPANFYNYIITSLYCFLAFPAIGYSGSICSLLYLTQICTFCLEILFASEEGFQSDPDILQHSTVSPAGP